MSILDKKDFHQKYPVSGNIKILVIILALAAIFLQNQNQRRISNSVIIRGVHITEYSKVHVETEYTLQNTTRKNLEINLLLKVYDATGKLLGSALYPVHISPQKTDTHIKIIDKLNRSLDKDEKPGKVSLEIYRRKVL
jgi:hypothetical protein